MGTTRTRRIGRREAEWLLSGVPAAVDRRELLRLLRLAAAPARSYELAGREATVAAMVAAYDRTPERTNYLSVLSRALAVKVAAVVGVLLLGGTAVAAGTGNLPSPVQHGLFSVLGGPVPDAPSPVRHTTPPPGRSTPATSLTPGERSTTTAPGTAGLCRAWEAQKDRTPDPVIVHALAAQAGGEQKIAAFCAAVLNEPNPRASPSAKPHPTPVVPTPSHQQSGKRPASSGPP
jgi:hypothetical protein